MSEGDGYKETHDMFKMKKKPIDYLIENESVQKTYGKFAEYIVNVK